MIPARWILGGCLCVSLAACADRQGIERLAMEHTLGVDPAFALDLGTQERPRVTAPIRLGLFFVTKTVPPFRTVRQASWTSAHKEQLNARLTELLVPRFLSEVFLLEDPLISGFDPGAVRQAGRRYAADAVLIIDGVAAVDRYNNSSAWWYATLVGAYLASGTEIEAACLARGSLHDVPTDRLYAAHTAEGRAERQGPAMLMEDSAVLRDAQEAALEQLAVALAEEIRRLSGIARAEPSRRIERPQQAQ